MLSLSLAFHLASALLLIWMFAVLAKYRRWIRFLRRWSDPQTAGVLVGEPMRVVAEFAAALDIPLTGYTAMNEEPVRVSLAPLFDLHTRCGIQEIRCSLSNGAEVSFVLARSSATIEEDQRSIELAFAKKLQIHVQVSLTEAT